VGPGNPARPMQSAGATDKCLDRRRRPEDVALCNFEQDGRLRVHCHVARNRASPPGIRRGTPQGAPGHRTSISVSAAAASGEEFERLMREQTEPAATERHSRARAEQRTVAGNCAIDPMRSHALARVSFGRLKDSIALFSSDSMSNTFASLVTFRRKNGELEPICSARIHDPMTILVPECLFLFCASCHHPHADCSAR
jgi:hypothetical protein